MGRSDKDDDVVRITTAARSRADDIGERQRRYLISMGIRMVCFFGAVAVGPGWFRWVLMAGAVLLPYVAVVVANSTDLRKDAFTFDRPGAAGELPHSSRDTLNAPEDD